MALLAHVGADPRASPTRQRIYDAIVQKPGHCFMDLVKAVGATGMGHVQYHLYVLERLGLVHHVKAGRRVHYYPTGGVFRPEAVADATATEPMRRRLLELVRERPGIRFADLQRQFPGSRQNTMYHLRYLETRDLVQIRRDPTAPRLQTAWPTGAPRRSELLPVPDDRSARLRATQPQAVRIVRSGGFDRPGLYAPVNERT